MDYLMLVRLTVFSASPSGSAIGAGSGEAFDILYASCIIDSQQKYLR